MICIFLGATVSPSRGRPRRAECAAEDLGTTQVERDTMGLGALGARFMGN